jgi:hypothetical protein
MSGLGSRKIILGLISDHSQKLLYLRVEIMELKALCSHSKHGEGSLASWRPFNRSCNLSLISSTTTRDEHLLHIASFSFTGMTCRSRHADKASRLKSKAAGWLSLSLIEDYPALPRDISSVPHFV